MDKETNAENRLCKLKEKLINRLEELKRYGNKKGEEKEYGKKTAYVECLELLLYWDKAKENEITEELIEQYPL